MEQGAGAGDGEEGKTVKFSGRLNDNDVGVLVQVQVWGWVHLEQFHRCTASMWIGVL